MRVTRVKIEHFKRFQDFETTLGPVNCIVGANNSGKTTLLQALALFDFCLQSCLEKKRRNGNGEHIELKGRSVSVEDFYVLPIANPVDLWTDRRLQVNRKHRVITLALDFDNGRSAVARIDLSYNRFGLSVETEDDQAWLKALAEWRIAYLPVFSTFLAQEEKRTRIAIQDELSHGRVNNVIRNLLLMLKEEQHEQELIAILRRVFPSLTHMNIEFDEGRNRFIEVTYRELGKQKAFDVLSAGSGFQQFIYLFGFILLRQPTVILLDKPDVHLHGTLQKALLKELNQLAAQNRQILFATHSIDMIGEIRPEDIVSLVDGQAQRLSVALEVYDTLEKLGSLENTQLPLIQAYQRVLVVENAADKDILFALCASVIEDKNWSEVERRLAVCYARGNPWKQDVDRLRQQLQQVVALKGQALQMFVVADRDYHPAVDDLRKKLKASQHIQWHVWQRAEIENYLLSLPTIVRVLSVEPLFQRALNDKFSQLIQESRNSANDHLADAFRELDRAQSASTLSRLSREYLEANWDTEWLELADAKDVVLPRLKVWTKQQGLGQFSDKALAQAMPPEEIPQEIHDLALRIATFAGVEVE